jgi:NADH dehydrogenase
LDFEDQLGLVASLRGVSTLYNTYWVRFAHGRVDHQLAIANSRTLFHAAKRAGVQRIVHISITHPSVDSPLRACARGIGDLLCGPSSGHPLRR